MAFNPTITLTAKSGQARRIAATYVSRDMAADAIWHSGNATEISSTPEELKNTDKEWIVWERGEWTKIQFEPDSDYDDGQGFNVQGPYMKWTVDSVHGDVYIIRTKYIRADDTKSDAYASGDRIAASTGAKLYLGDMILCAKGSADFTVRIEASEDIAQYLALAIVQEGLCSE